MKVLFLDVDGVLNQFSPEAQVEGVLLEHLRTITNLTGCQIVLSSSWRFWTELKAKLSKSFEVYGIPLWIDQTPDLGRYDGDHYVPRHKEISMWLEEHPEVEKYAIVDDDLDAGIPGDSDNFFPTNPLSGLTTDLAEKITKHLNS